MLNSVVFCALLEWISWCIRPRGWATYPVEGLGVSELAYITRADTGYFVMPLGATWGSDPGGRSWVPGSSDSYCQDSLVRGMPEDSLRCHSFARVNFSYVAIYGCSSTRLFQFPGTVTFLIPHVLQSGECVIKDHMVLGKNMPSSGV